MWKKTIVSLALTSALLLTAQAAPVSAAEYAYEAVPQTISTQIMTARWTSTNTVVPSISISGTKISVSLIIDPKESTTTSEGKLYLQKKNGSSWTTVISWSFSGTGTVCVSKTYYGTTGVTYRTRVVVTTGSDEIDAVSTSITV